MLYPFPSSLQDSCYGIDMLQWITVGSSSWQRCRRGILQVLNVKKYIVRARGKKFRPHLTFKIIFRNGVLRVRYEDGKNLILEGPCIIFCNIYTVQRDTQCSSTECLLMHRCQLYMFRTVTVHPQELLCRCCMCRLWYVVRNALSGTSRWCDVWGSSSSNVVPAGRINTYHSLHIQHLKRSSWGWTVTVRNM